MRTLLLLIPEGFLPLLVVAAGLAIIVGARAMGRGLLLMALAMAVLPILLASLFDSLPPYLLWLVVGALTMGLVLSLLRALFVGMLGRDATNAMVGHLAADAVRGSFLAGCRALGWVLRALARALRWVMVSVFSRSARNIRPP